MITDLRLLDCSISIWSYASDFG